MSRHESGGIVIFRSLGTFSVLLAVMAVVFGRDVRYLKLSPGIAKDSIASRLFGLGIKALSYEDVDDGLGKYSRLLSAWSTTLFREHVRDDALESVIGDDLDLNATARERFLLACEHYFQSELEEPIELLLFCLELKAQLPGTRITVVGQLDVPLRLLFSRATNGEDWRLWGLPRIPMLDYVKRLFMRYVRMAGKGSKDAPHLPGLAAARHDQRVIYFPHQGLFFGELFAKDHYYSADPMHALHPSKILHISLGESDEVLSSSHVYYREHEIPYADLMQLTRASPRKWLARYLKLIISIRRVRSLASNVHPLQMYKTMFYLARYSHLQLFLEGVGQFSKAQLALVGYDILFPPMLSVALAARSITVVATQERFFTVFYNTFRLVFDYYFPLGRRACQHIHDWPDKFSIEHCVPVGPVRSELIVHWQAAIPEKYRTVKEKQVLILGLDWNSVSTAVQNARIKTNTWRANKRYYRDMIRLAEEFPEVHIVIKGRDNSSLIPEMESECRTIENMPNMSIERDHMSYPPARMAAAADLTIACHTSLVDELLAVGRPAISYDFCGFPTSLFDYDGYPIIVRSYAQLRERVFHFISHGEIMGSDQFEQMRGDFYNVIPGEVSPREKLINCLAEILHKNMIQ